jgi:hypothetical protein
MRTYSPYGNRITHGPRVARFWAGMRKEGKKEGKWRLYENRRLNCEPLALATSHEDATDAPERSHVQPKIWLAAVHAATLRSDRNLCEELARRVSKSHFQKDG